MPTPQRPDQRRPSEPVATANGFRVVIFTAPEDARRLRDLLVSELNLHPTDAMVRATDVPGVLPVHLDEQTGHRLVEKLKEANLDASVIPQQEIPEIEHAPVVHHARCLDTGLELVELHGEEQAMISWPDVGLISVGHVPQEPERQYVASTTTVTAARRTLPPPHEAHMPSGPELWLLCNNPERALRIDHKRMNYEYLGERKTDSGTHNFRLLLEDIVRYAPHAYQTPATRALLEHGPITDFLFNSSGDLLRYTVFHILVHRHQLEKGRTDFSESE